MARRFRRGQVYEYREIADYVTGGDDRFTDPGQPYLCLDGFVFEPLLEPLVDGAAYGYDEICDRMSGLWRRDADPNATFIYRAGVDGGTGYLEEVVEPSPYSLIEAATVAAAIRKLSQAWIGRERHRARKRAAATQPRELWLGTAIYGERPRPRSPRPPRARTGDGASGSPPREGRRRVGSCVGSVRAFAPTSLAQSSGTAPASLRADARIKL
jgi:hypothetical protein